MDYQQKYFEKWDVLSGYSYGNLMRVCKNPGQCGYLAEKGEYGVEFPVMRNILHSVCMLNRVYFFKGKLSKSSDRTVQPELMRS